MFRKIWYDLGKFFVSVVARAGFELNIQWDAPLPDEPVILAANHPSTFDPALLTTLIKRRISVLIHGPIFKLPVFGRSLLYCGHIPVIRGSGGESLAHAEALLKAGRSVAIFPEGAISPPGGFHTGRTGVARLALRSGAPVIPVGISLDHKRLLRVEQTIDGVTDTGGYYFHGPYAMTVGRPARFKGSVDDHSLVRNIAAEVMEQIIQLSLESSRRSRAYSKQNWWFTTRWWMYSPLRLIRSWNIFANARIR